MNKRRSVNTKVWSDEWFEELNSTYKLLWLYLITNQYTNMLGIYEVSVRRISFETGMDKASIEKAFKVFEKDSKAFYRDGYVILANWLKNQAMNKNMLISAEREYNELPKELKDSIHGNDSKGFERVIEGFGTLRKKEGEEEGEYEKEKESEIKGKNRSKTLLKTDYPTKQLFIKEMKEYADGKYYNWNLAAVYEEMYNWSEANLKKKNNWLATAANWMKKDEEKYNTGNKRMPSKKTHWT